MENISHLSTGYIPSQFHLFSKDLFETVICARYDESIFNSICNDIFELNRYWYTKDEHDDTGKLIYRLPPLEEVWLDEQYSRDCRNEVENQCRRQEDCICKKNISVPDIISWIQRIIMSGLQQVPLSLTTIQVLILCWDIHLQNKRGIFSLIMLMMGILILHILLLMFHHCHSLQLQILLNREIHL